MSISLNKDKLCQDVCPACNLAFRNNSPTFSAISKEIENPISFQCCSKCGCLYARDAVALATNIYRNRTSTNFSPKKLNFLRRIKKRIIQINYYSLIRRKKVTQIIDYGCGNGDIANALMNYVETVIAVDVAKDRPTGLNNEILYISSDELNQHSLDSARTLFILRHVLEHFEQPIKELQKLKNLAAEGDLFLIETPNANSIFRAIMRSGWPGYFPPFHVTVPTLTALKIIAETVGLEIISFSTKEPPIIGTWLTQKSVRFNNFFRMIGLVLYPFQWLLSKVTIRSEAVEVLLCKRS